MNLIRRKCANFHLGPWAQKMTPHDEAEYMTATGSSLIGFQKQSCARERSIYVCGESLILGKSVIRHTQLGRIGPERVIGRDEAGDVDEYAAGGGSAGQRMRTHDNQPPVKPARRKPTTTGGQRRMRFQSKPVR